jgi:hypothetical protein
LHNITLYNKRLSGTKKWHHRIQSLTKEIRKIVYKHCISNVKSEKKDLIATNVIPCKFNHLKLAVPNSSLERKIWKRGAYLENNQNEI